MVQRQTRTAPTVLSLEEYRREWEPQGWRLLTIGPTETWREEWGLWEAIRDIVQNALDEAESYTFGYDDQGLWIRDAGRGVAIEDFLLGPARPKPDTARGKFGEGMKIAALALLREGYSVHVETVGRELWVVFLRQRVDGEANVLAALWRRNGRTRGTEWHIIGYFGVAYEDRFAVNLPREAVLFRGPSTLTEPVPRWNQLIGGPVGLPFTGRLYARDIYVREIDSRWSYNLWGFPMAPDRHGAKREEDIWVDAGRLWCTATDPALVEELLGMLARPPEVEGVEATNLNLSRFDLGRDPTGTPYLDYVTRESAWGKAWERKFGPWAVVETDPSVKHLVTHLGYDTVAISFIAQDAAVRAAPMTDRQLVQESQERLREAEAIPDGQLTQQQRVHLDLARAIANRAALGVQGVRAAVIPPASERMRTAGMYSTATREVLISPEQLDRASSTVDTTIHEVAHHISRAEDLTDLHSREMSALAGRVVRWVHQGTFDTQLREAVW